jgi:hypothetical protein
MIGDLVLDAVGHVAVTALEKGESAVRRALSDPPDDDEESRSEDSRPERT